MSLGKFSAFGDIVRSTRPSYEYRATPENVELIAELEAVDIPSFFKKKNLAWLEAGHSDWALLLLWVNSCGNCVVQ